MKKNRKISIWLFIIVLLLIHWAYSFQNRLFNDTK